MSGAQVTLAVVLLLATVVGGVDIVVDGHRRPFRSIKAPKETVVNYEAVLPKVSFIKESKEGFPELMHVSIPTLRHNYSLILELNEQLVPPKFTSRSFDERGQEVVTKGHVNCFYQGRVEGHPDWRVTMTTCHGLQGSFGDQRDKEGFFHLEPLSKGVHSLEQLHAFYPDSEYKLKQGSCGSNHSHMLRDTMGWPNLGYRQSESHRLRRQSSTQHIVEWVAVNDERQYIANERNLSMTVMRALAIANEVDSLYRQLMIRVVLIESITWTKGDQIQVTSDPDNLLREFLSYRPRISTPHDSAMLFTGIEIEGDTAGVAYLTTMCSDTDSLGFTQDGGRSLSSVSSIAAHELGHIFNMNHDDANRQCNCADGDQGCIMAAVSSFPPPTQWSSCSRADLMEGFTMFNLDRCLSNQPSTSVGDPVCGNGIREGDEICDCGSAQECTDPCCNPVTCQLASGAQCSAGECCSGECQFLSYGTECRAAEGDCDIAEYCPGDSGQCPADDHQRNGISCNDGRGYCYGGRCPTHDAQCQVAFGSNKGDDSCYSHNRQGEQSGNCGHTSTEFIACSPDDVQCGLLQCMAGAFLLDKLPVQHFTLTIGRSVICRSFTTLPGSDVDVEGPGLVQDGTQCGNGMACLSQRCVPVSQITTMPCETTNSNSSVCSGNGVCNNRGTCSCNVGFMGASCAAPFTGPGGSPEGKKNNSGAVAGAVIGTLLGLAVLVGVIVAIVFIVLKRQRNNYIPRAPSWPSRVVTKPPSVKVVRPGKPSAGHHAPSSSFTPSAPPSYDNVVGSDKSSVPNRPPPPKPVSRPPPPKPQSHAPPKPPPPVNRPAMQPHSVAPTASKPPPQAAPKSSKVQGRWPPSEGNSAPARPAPPSKKPIIPPR